MARQNPWQSDFISGELTPKLHARVDLQKYSSGVAELTNFIIQLQGGVARRSGTIFTSPIKDQTNKSWIIPFVISVDNAYVIEMGNEYFRFYKNGGLLQTNAQTYTNVPIEILSNLGANNLMLLTGSPTGFQLTQGLTYTVTGSAKIPDGTTFVNNYPTDTSVLLSAGASSIGTDTATLTPTNVPVEIVTPYLTAELPFIDFAQSADTLFLVHPNHPPMYLIMDGGLTALSSSPTIGSPFSLDTFNYQDGPYMTQNQVQTALLEHSGFNEYDYIDPVSGTTYHQYNGSGTITASGTDALGNAFAPFVSTDVGRWIRILQGSFWGAVQITAVSSSTVVTGTVFGPVALADSGKSKITIGSTTYPINTIYPTFVWRMGSWSDTTGYPSAVTFHQGRLCFSNSPTEPQGFWTSESNIFNLFSPTENDVSVVDSNGLGYTIVSNQVNSVQWMLSAQALMVGTNGSEFAVITSSNGTPLTPSNIAFQQQSTFGSKKIRPYLIGVSVLYVQRSGEKLREQTYDWSINGWRSTEISMLSEHLFREGGGIVQAAYQQEPSNIWWGVREDGILVGMTYVKEQQIIGFHKHIIGGTFQGGNAVVESICVIPTSDGNQDQLWMIVKRTINGSTARYVEFMDVAFDASVAGKNSMNFVDSGQQTTGFPVPLVSAIADVSGLDHLEGETVAICGDTVVQISQVVSSGTVTLAKPAKLLTIGLPYVSQLKTLPLPVQGDFGTGQGITKRVDRIILRILDSLTFKVGKDYDHLGTIPFATTISAMDSSPPLFTGDKDFSLNSSYDDLADFCVQADLPYPLNLLGMSPQLVVQPK